MLVFRSQRILLGLAVMFAAMFSHIGVSFAKTTASAAPTSEQKSVSPKPNDSDDGADDDDDSVDSDDPDDSSDDSGEDDDALVEQGKALSANVTLVTDYILRGLSQTDHAPAIQGGFDWQHPTGFNLGVWGSNVHFQDLPESLELDAYGGYTYKLAPTASVGVGALYYSYWSDGTRNSWEYSATGKWRGFSLEVDYSPNWQKQDAQSWYFQAGWQGPVIWDVTLGAQVGYSAFSDSGDPDYADCLIFASREFFEVEWKLSGVFVNTQTINSAEGGDRAILSMTKSF